MKNIHIIPTDKPKQLFTEDFGLPQFGTKEFNDLASQCFGGKPKQDALNHFSSTSSVIVKDPQTSNFNKQETLEEAAKNYAEEHKWEEQDPWLDFIEGAKWQQENSNINALDFEINSLKREIKVLKHQQERSYSEEEVLNKLTHFAVKIQRQNKKGVFPLRIKEWFERNKKK